MNPNTPGLKFSERVAIEKEFMEHCLNTGNVNCASNFLLWLILTGDGYGKTIVTKLFKKVSR